MESKKTGVKIVSERLRRTKKDISGLVFPDERDGLNPYSLICGECGNYKVFMYEAKIRVRVTIDGDIVHHEYFNGGRLFSNNANKSSAMVLERHLPHEFFSVAEKFKRKVTCARCSSDDVILYGSILSECYMNNCVGCFKCGGAYNEENIFKHCETCLSLRADLADDRSIFLMTLDMDLYCDACPILNVREGYNISGDEIKKKVSGKLV